MSRGPGRTMRRIAEVLADARTVEPWPVFMTVYGLARHVYEVEYVTRAQVETVRRACKRAAALDYWWLMLDVPTHTSVTGRAERAIGAARLKPSDPVQVELWEAWWHAPPVVKDKHPCMSRRLHLLPVDMPAYQPPDGDALAHALGWYLARVWPLPRKPGTVTVDRADIIRAFNAYCPDQAGAVERYESLSVDKAKHVAAPQQLAPCFHCGRPWSEVAEGAGWNGVMVCVECGTGTTNALALAGRTDLYVGGAS